MNVSKLFDNVAMTATSYSKWIDTRCASAVNLHISWIGTGTPVGAFTIEFSNDPQAGKEAALNTTPAAGTAAKVDVTSGIPAAAIVGTGLSVSGGANGSTIVNIENPTAFVRVVYTRSSGGSAASLLNGWLAVCGVGRP